MFSLGRWGTHTNTYHPVALHKVHSKVTVLLTVKCKTDFLKHSINIIVVAEYFNQTCLVNK